MSQFHHFGTLIFWVVIVLVLTTRICGASGHSCRINKWCRPADAHLSAEYEYKFINPGPEMRWFDALDKCRLDGS